MTQNEIRLNRWVSSTIPGQTDILFDPFQPIEFNWKYESSIWFIPWYLTSVSRDDWYWTSRGPDQREFIDYAAINIHRIPGILVLIIISWVIIYESQSLDYVKAICFCIINNCSPSIDRVSADNLSIGWFESSMNVYGALRFKTFKAFECFKVWQVVMMNEQFSKTIYGFSEGNCPEICPEQSPDSPSEKTVTQTVWSGLTVFWWPKSIYWYHSQGADCIYTWTWRIYILTFLVLSHQGNISDSDTPEPKVKGEIPSRGQS